jgi:hypothetical protein
VAVTYTYPEAEELKLIEQELLPTLSEDDPILKEFPTTEVRSDRVRWEQKDNYKGLQQLRGLNGAPNFVNRVGAKEYDFAPGVYGEFTLIDEKELTTRRQWGTFGDPITIDDLIADAQAFLLQRRLDRLRLILWTLVLTGTFSVPHPRGGIMHTDVFNIQTFDSNVGWGTYATATPFADIRALALKYRGKSVDFGKGARLYINRTTLNNLLLNQNAADAYGRRLPAGATINQLDEAQSILTANDLPQIAPYDGGYIDETGTFQLFIPDNKGVLVGRRTNGASLGEYRMTVNANNPNLEPGAYTRVIDRGEDTVPRTIEVHDGHNGGPLIYFPSAIVACDFS